LLCGGAFDLLKPEAGTGEEIDKREIVGCGNLPVVLGRQRVHVARGWQRN
jgi:hypothetical protein